MDIGAVLANGIVENVELLVANHLQIDCVTEGITADKEGRQMGDVLGEEIKDDCVDGSPSGAPDFRKRECYSDEDPIWRHHHDAAHNVDQQEYHHERRWFVLILLHKLINLVSVEVLQEDEEEYNVADNDNDEDVHAEAVCICCRIQRVVNRMGSVLGEESRSRDA